MSDNLKITAPVNTNENISKVRPKEVPGVIIDPTKVGSRNQNEQANKQGIMDYRLNHQSVYNRFLQELQQTPQLNATLKKILLEAFSRKSGVMTGNQLEMLLKEFTGHFQMTDTKMIAQHIKYQLDNTTKFNGELFSALRELFAGAQQKNDQELSNLIGKFLKSYDNFFSAEDNIYAALITLKNIAAYMLPSSANELRDFTAAFQQTASVQGAKQAAEILKNEILPFLSKYIKTTNDLGKLRDMVTLLVHYTARLNAGTIDHLTQDFVNLLDYCRFSLNMRNHDLDSLENAFAMALSKSESNDNDLYESLIEIIKLGIKDNPSAVSKAIYKDIASAMLLDQSTFMPLTHLYLPLNYHGVFMFSEIWIDHEKDEDVFSGEQTAREKSFRLYITFDIQKLGLFEAVIRLNGKKTAALINYPISLKSKNKEIRDSVSTIFKAHGFELTDFNLTAGAPAQKLEQVFPHLYERKRSVNVSI